MTAMGHVSCSRLSSLKGGVLSLGYSAAQHQAGVRGLGHTAMSPGGLAFTDWGPHPQSLSTKFKVLLRLSGKHTVELIMGLVHEKEMQLSGRVANDL